MAPNHIGQRLPIAAARLSTSPSLEPRRLPSLITPDVSYSSPLAARRRQITRGCLLHRPLSRPGYQLSSASPNVPQLSQRSSARPSPPSTPDATTRAPITWSDSYMTGHRSPLLRLSTRPSSPSGLLTSPSLHLSTGAAYISLHGAYTPLPFPQNNMVRCVKKINKINK